jgi:hypothetical protein
VSDAPSSANGRSSSFTKDMREVLQSGGSRAKSSHLSMVDAGIPPEMCVVI